MAMGVWRCRECGVTVTAPSSRVLEKMGWTVFPIPVEERGKPSPVACPICKREHGPVAPGRGRPHPEEMVRASRSHG